MASSTPTNSSLLASIRSIYVRTTTIPAKSGEANNLPTLPKELVEAITTILIRGGSLPDEVLPLRLVCRHTSRSTWDLFRRYFHGQAATTGILTLPAALIQNIATIVARDGASPEKLLPLRMISRHFQMATRSLFRRYFLENIRIVMSDQQSVATLIRLSDDFKMARHVKCIRFALFCILRPDDNSRPRMRNSQKSTKARP